MRLAERVNKIGQLISKPIAFFAATYVLIAFILFALNDPSTKFGGLSSNLFAGSIDTFLAVVLVNFLIAQDADRRSRPLRFAAYLDLNAAVSNLLGTWADMYKACNTQAPAKGVDLLSIDNIEYVVQHLNTNAESGFLGQTFEMRLVGSAEQSYIMLGNVMARYASALDPSMLSDITFIENCNSMSMIRNYPNTKHTFQGSGMISPSITQILGATMDEKEATKWKSLLSQVQSMSKEFEQEDGFRPVFDFAKSIELMSARDDLAPRLGSAIRPA